MLTTTYTVQCNILSYWYSPQVCLGVWFRVISLLGIHVCHFNFKVKLYGTDLPCTCTCTHTHTHTVTPTPTHTHTHSLTHSHFHTLTIDKRITELYADAAKHYPKNQEILTHLFMAYVRVGDYQKQQQTAAALHKTFPESGPYYCWRVMSVLMQVCHSLVKSFHCDV